MDDLMDNTLVQSRIENLDAKVESVEIHEFRHMVENAAVEPGGFSRIYEPGAQSPMTSFVVRIVSSDGTVGEYCPVMGGRRWHMAQVLRLAPGLVGRNPYERESIYDDFKRALQGVAFVGVGPIDCCLWDMAGKRLGASVSKLLGGYRKKIKAYASCMHGDHNGGLTSVEDVLAFATYCEELGFKAFKFHGWGDGNVADLKKVVSALGKEFAGRLDLMLDPGCDLRTFADALAIGHACDEAGFFWYEDPFRDGGVSQAAHRKLRQKIKTPLLITEHVRGLEAKADWIVSESTDFLRADPEVDLGITGTMKIAHVAEAFGMDVEIHGPGPAHRACMSAVRNTNYYEVGLVGPEVKNYMSPPIYSNGYSDQLEGVDKDGFYPVPSEPGLGVEHDWDFIKEHTINVHRFE
jgi:L-alanine-DL-glutamate epimerase-like enolase superfamily enzyme